jgi:hypothetical protein
VARSDARIRLALVRVSPSGEHRHPAARHWPVLKLGLESFDLGYPHEQLLGEVAGPGR